MKNDDFMKFFSMTQANKGAGVSVKGPYQWAINLTLIAIIAGIAYKFFGASFKKVFGGLLSKITGNNLANEHENGTVQQTYPTTNGDLNLDDVAIRLSKALGFYYSSWNPQSWTENDREAVSLIMSVPKVYIKELIRAYAQVNQEGRSFTKDISVIDSSLRTPEFNSHIS